MVKIALLLSVALPLGVGAAAVKATAVQLLQSEAIVSPQELGFEFFNDPDMPCTYMCDYRPISMKIPRPLTDDEKTALKEQPIYTSVNTINTNCPSIRDANSKLFDVSTLILQPTTHLIMYGHSYLWESFHVIRAAHKFLGQIVKQTSLCGNDSECDGYKGCICSGGTQQLGEPYCGGVSNFNCNCAKGTRYYFSNGATLTGVFNWDVMQRRSNVERLVEHITGGVDGQAYTHALVMEPHPDIFFVNPALSKMATDEKYGCGWSQEFWDAWHAATPVTAKVFHVPAWGYSSANQAVYSAAPMMIVPNTQANNCTAESQWTLGETKASIFASGGIQGHHCIAARDNAGFNLGVVPKMAAEILARMYG